MSNVHKSETPVPIRSQWAVLPQQAAEPVMGR